MGSACQWGHNPLDNAAMSFALLKNAALREGSVGASKQVASLARFAE